MTSLKVMVHFVFFVEWAMHDIVLDMVLLFLTSDPWEKGHWHSQKYMLLSNIEEIKIIDKLSLFDTI